MDVSLLLNDDVKKYLAFNDKNHTILIDDDIPENHPLQNFIQKSSSTSMASDEILHAMLENENVGSHIFDCDKYFDRVGW